MFNSSLFMSTSPWSGKTFHRKMVWATVIMGLLGLTSLNAEEKQKSTATTQPAQKKIGPKVRCDNPVYNFTDVWAGEKVKHTFILHNDGDETLKISNVRGGCGCTAVPNYDKEIPPGGKGEVSFIVTTSPRAPKKTVRPSVQTNDPKNQSLKLTIQGTLKLRIAIDPIGGANWGTIRKDQKVGPRKVKITNNTSTPMKIEPVPKRGTSIFTWSINETIPGKETEITFVANQPFREGANREYLNFNTGIPEQKQISILCYLYSQPLIEIRSPNKNLTVRLPNTPDQKPVYSKPYLKYNGEGEMNIKSTIVSDPAIKAKLRPQTPGKAYYVEAVVPNDYKPNPKKPVKIIITTDVQEKPLEIPITFAKMPSRPKTTPSAKPEELIGKTAPMLPVKTSENKLAVLGAINKKTTIINFWATYCRVSARQLPILEKIYQDYKSKNVEFLNVCTDPRNRKGQEIKGIAQQRGSNILNALDTTRLAVAKYNVKRVPTLFLINKNGTVEAVHSLPNTDELNTLEATIRTELDLLLAGKTRADFPKKPQTDKKTTPAKDEAKAQTQIPGAPKLVITDSSQQNTGRHKMGETVTYEIKYQNKGTAPLEVTTVKPITEGLKVQPDFARQLQPNAAGVLKCQFKAPNKPGEFKNQLVIQTNDPNHSNAQITLTSEIPPYIEVTPATGIDFSRKTMTHSMPRLATLTYNGPGKVGYLATQSSTPKFEATVTPIGNTNYAKLIVKSKPPFDLGENNGLIRIRTTCKEQPIVEVPVTLFLPPTIEISPPKVEIKKSSRLQRSTVSIINNGLASLNILGIQKSNPKIRTQFYPEPDGRSYKLELIIPAAFDSGSAPATVTIKTDSKEFREIVIPIQTIQ